MKHVIFVKVFKLTESSTVLQKKKSIQIETKKVHVTLSVNRTETRIVQISAEMFVFTRHVCH